MGGIYKIVDVLLSISDSETFTEVKNHVISTGNVHVCGHKTTKAQIPLGSTRHVRLCRASRDERVERDEPCSSNMADDERSCTSMLLHTQILFVSSLNKCILQLISE